MASQPIGRSPKRYRGERKPREERWAELLDVAAIVFYEKGYRAASLNEIAARMNMLKGSLYYYIASKDELLFEVVRASTSEGMDNIRDIVAGPGDPLERLETAIVAHIEYNRKNIHRVGLMHEIHVLPPAMRTSIRQVYEDYELIFENLLREGEEKNSVRADVDVKLAALSILGSINSVVRWHRNTDYTPEDVVRHLADVTVRGLASPDGLKRLNAARRRSAARRAS